MSSMHLMAQIKAAYCQWQIVQDEETAWPSHANKAIGLSILNCLTASLSIVKHSDQGCTFSANLAQLILSTTFPSSIQRKKISSIEQITIEIEEMTISSFKSQAFHMLG